MDFFLLKVIRRIEKTFVNTEKWRKKGKQNLKKEWLKASEDWLDSSMYFQKNQT